MSTYKQPKSKYLVGFNISNGLNLTLDQNKIKKNCKLLDIDMSNTPSKISKRNIISILTIGVGNNNYIQYEVKHNLNCTGNVYIPYEIKPLILQAYKLTHVKTLNDLITI